MNPLLEKNVNALSNKDLSGLEEKEMPEVAALAVVYYRDGLYCSEALLRAFNEVYELGLPENAYKMATGFGSGMAESGCACGTITSCVMVLGMVVGRTHKGESEILVYDAVKKLQDLFKKEYKSACCRVLTKTVTWGSKEHTCLCEKYVVLAACITDQILKEDLHDYLPKTGNRKTPKKISILSLKRRLRGTFNRDTSRTK